VVPDRQAAVGTVRRRAEADPSLRLADFNEAGDGVALATVRLVGNP
jgi:hypothetical protein